MRRLLAALLLASCLGRGADAAVVSPGNLPTAGFLAGTDNFLLTKDGINLLKASLTQLAGYLGSISILAYNADPTGTTDNSAVFSTAFAANCGKSLFVPAGTYKFTSGVTSTCALTLIMDPAAVILDAITPTVLTTVFSFQGTKGSSTALTGDSLAGTFTVALTSAAGFCQPANTGIPDPRCAVMLQDNNTWDPTLNSHTPGEIRLIKSISANTLTLFDRIEGNYRVATWNATASPVSLLDRVGVTGGTIQGPFVDNNHKAVQCYLCWKATVARTTFKYFGGQGSVEWNDAIGFTDSDNMYVGVGALGTGALGDAYLTTIVDASSYGDVHDNIYWNGGPCVTVADSPTGTPGTTRHLNIHNNQCFGARGFNSYQIQTHFQGEDINIFDNTVSSVDGPGSTSKGISIGVPNVVIDNNTIWNVNGGYGIQAENGTNQVGYIDIHGNAVFNVGSHCIVIQQNVSGSTGFFSQIRADANTLRNCGGYGVNYVGGGSTVDSNGSISGNNINGIASTYIGILVNPAIQIFGIDNNTILLNNANQKGIQVTDSFIGTISGNKIKMAAGNTSAGITHNCTSPSSGNNVSISNNILSSPSDVSGTGVTIANNCTGDNLGYNNVGGFTTGQHLSTGAGNRVTGPLNGITGNILPVAGACAVGTATIPGVYAGGGFKVTWTPGTYQGDNVNPTAVISGADTVTVHVCAAVGSTPVSTAYSVSVTQ